MAEGGYDPTTENKTPWEDHVIDHDDDDDDTTGPGTPGAASTPYRPGTRYHPDEEHEMSTFPTEDSGLVHTYMEVTYLYLSRCKCYGSGSFYRPDHKKAQD